MAIVVTVEVVSCGDPFVHLSVAVIVEAVTDFCGTRIDIGIVVIAVGIICHISRRLVRGRGGAGRVAIAIIVCICIPGGRTTEVATAIIYGGIGVVVSGRWVSTSEYLRLLKVHGIIFDLSRARRGTAI